MKAKQVRIRLWSGRAFRDFYIDASHDASHVVDGNCDWAENKMMELEDNEPGIMYDRYEVLPDDREEGK